jgi:RNA polymerase-binding transcription factor DksA
MATPKKTAAKAAKAKSSVKSVKKAAPAKKAVTAKKAAPASKVVAKGTKKAAPAPKKVTPVKKAAPTKATSAQKGAAVKKATPAKKDIKQVKTVKKANDKTNKAKAIPAKKAAPAKKAVAAKPVAKAPAKKVAAPAAKAAPAKKAAPAPKAPPAAAKKEAPVKKAVVAAAVKPAAVPTAKPASKASGKKAAAKQPIKSVTTFAKTALPGRTTSSAPVPSRASVPVSRTVREEKKPAVIVARRVLENKSKKADEGRTMINYQPDYTRSILDEPEMSQGPVYRYSDDELNEFRDLIQGRLEAARKELVYLQGLITRKDEAGTEDTENRYMNMEDGSGAMEREQLAQLASRQIQFINHLEKALIRIENKTYGICRVTGKLIDKARLRAVPHATLSIEAKKTMSKS